jgi:HEPN domain-containing protein
MVKKVGGDDWVIMPSITPPDRSLPISIQKDIVGLEIGASRQFYLHNYPESMKLYNKILDLLEQTQTNINRPIHKGVPLHMIGLCYSSTNEHDKALRYIMLAYIEDTLNVNFKFEDSADAAPAARMLRDYYNINPKILQAVKELSQKAKSDGKWSKILDPNTILQELEVEEKIDSNKLTEQLTQPASKQPVPTQPKLARAYEEAENLCSEAYKVYFRSQNLSESDYNGAIEAAQHCIELSVKALIKLVGLEYHTKHDPSTQLEEVIARLNGLSDYDKVSIARAKWISTMWEWSHSTSIYGSLNVQASNLFREKDVKSAVEYASEMHSCCSVIISRVKNGQVKIV